MLFNVISHLTEMWRFDWQAASRGIQTWSLSIDALEKLNLVSSGSPLTYQTSALPIRISNLLPIRAKLSKNFHLPVRKYAHTLQCKIFLIDSNLNFNFSNPFINVSWNVWNKSLDYEQHPLHISKYGRSTFRILIMDDDDSMYL